MVQNRWGARGPGRLPGARGAEDGRPAGLHAWSNPRALPGPLAPSVSWTGSPQAEGGITPGHRGACPHGRETGAPGARNTGAVGGS